jgi:hypothetical protein
LVFASPTPSIDFCVLKSFQTLNPSSPMACVDCASGIINEGIPQGAETTIYGLPTYVARPAGPPKGLIVIVPDAFGWNFSNGRVLADSYAEKGGFLVYLPDFMNGMSGHTALIETVDTMAD